MRMGRYRTPSRSRRHGSWFARPVAGSLRSRGRRSHGWRRSLVHGSPVRRRSLRSRRPARVSSLPPVGRPARYRSPLARSEALAPLAPPASRSPVRRRSLRSRRPAHGSLRSPLARSEALPTGRASRCSRVVPPAGRCSRLPSVTARPFGGAPYRSRLPLLACRPSRWSVLAAPFGHRSPVRRRSLPVAPPGSRLPSVTARPFGGAPYQSRRPARGSLRSPLAHSEALASLAPPRPRH
jgi:hypothetical protein